MTSVSTANEHAYARIRAPRCAHAVSKFAFATKTGISTNHRKVNQDMRITVPYFCGYKYSHLFCVADGHGHNGEKVSSFLSIKLP